MTFKAQASPHESSRFPIPGGSARFFLKPMRDSTVEPSIETQGDLPGSTKVWYESL